MNKEVPILFSEKSKCCGCGACYNVCPRSAISMKDDEYGFSYPIINSNICVHCNLCKQVCSFQNKEEKNEPIQTYAAVAKNTRLVKNSASGGVFAAIADSVLNEKGIVFGAQLLQDYSVIHRSIEKKEEIKYLQGSKYVQSDTKKTFSEVREELLTGKKVVYSGTPCQIAGLYGYLGMDYDNLLTVDIVCHGVPNNKMLKDYIDSFGSIVSDFKFRDKSIGWGINGSFVLNNKKVKLWRNSSSYLYYFTRGWIYRENCYKCKYTSEHRPADITLGDYWGIEKEHPEYLGKNGWDENQGISVIIVNTKKGIKFIDNMETIEYKPSTFEKAEKMNHQLREPSKKGERDKILNIYNEYGWSGVESMFNKNIGLKKYLNVIKNMVPNPIKRILKRRGK